MFDHDACSCRIKNALILRGVLFDDRKIRDDNNHAAQVVLLRVCEREGHPGKRFAAAGRDGQRKEAGRLRRNINALLKDLMAQLIKFAC